MNLYAIRTVSTNELVPERYVVVKRNGTLDYCNTYTFSTKFANELEASQFIRDNFQLLSSTFDTSRFEVVIPFWSDEDYQNILDRMGDDVI